MFSLREILAVRCNIFPTLVTLKCQQWLISQLPHDARCKQPTKRLQGEEVEKNHAISQQLFYHISISSPQMDVGGDRKSHLPPAQ